MSMRYSTSPRSSLPTSRRPCPDRLARRVIGALLAGLLAAIQNRSHGPLAFSRRENVAVRHLPAIIARDDDTIRKNVCAAINLWHCCEGKAIGCQDQRQAFRKGTPIHACAALHDPLDSFV